MKKPEQATKKSLRKSKNMTIISVFVIGVLSGLFGGWIGVQQSWYGDNSQSMSSQERVTEDAQLISEIGRASCRERVSVVV